MNSAPASNALDDARNLLAGCLFLPPEKIGDEADIHSLQDMDSLSFESIVAEIEARTGREVDPLDLLELRTVRDLAALLARMRAPGAAAG